MKSTLWVSALDTVFADLAVERVVQSFPRLLYICKLSSA